MTSTSQQIVLRHCSSWTMSMFGYEVEADLEWGQWGDVLHGDFKILIFVLLKIT